MFSKRTGIPNCGKNAKTSTFHFNRTVMSKNNKRIPDKEVSRSNHCSEWWNFVNHYLMLFKIDSILSTVRTFFTSVCVRRVPFPEANRI